jgi:hypothetical protein
VAASLGDAASRRQISSVRADWLSV